MKPSSDPTLTAHLGAILKFQMSLKFFGPGLLGSSIIFNLLGSVVGPDSDRGRLVSLEAAGGAAAAAATAACRWWRATISRSSPAGSLLRDGWSHCLDCGRAWIRISERASIMSGSRDKFSRGLDELGGAEEGCVEPTPYESVRCGGFDCGAIGGTPLLLPACG